MRVDFQFCKRSGTLCGVHHTPPIELRWASDAVSFLMSANGIQDRGQLAKMQIGVGQTTIYRSFDEQWAGKVQIRMLAALSRWLNIDLPSLVAALVVDPVLEGTGDE